VIPPTLSEVLVLALDTSSPAVSAALVRVTPNGREVLAEHVVVDARRHGELLALGVRAVLDGRPAADLGAVVVGLGPGPFTGLRVGLVTAATMADALGVPAYGVCSLDAVGEGDRVVVTDARRKEVYWARYAAGARVEGPAVERPAVLAERLQGSGARLVGAGAVLHRDALDGLTVDDSTVHASGPALVRLASDRLLEGAPSEALTPLYLRRPDAVAPEASKKVTAPEASKKVTAPEASKKVTAPEAQEGDGAGGGQEGDGAGGEREVKA
jgi:tRNA threonylcarbamoyl adenosine modification protein YeaZ